MPRPRRYTRRLRFTLDDESYRKLGVMAESEGVTKSEMARRLIDRYARVGTSEGNRNPGRAH